MAQIPTAQYRDTQTGKHITTGGSRQSPETAMKVQKILEKHGGDHEKASKDLAELAAEQANKVSAPKVELSEAAMQMRQYLIAVAQAMSGQFDQLSNEELVRVVALCKIPVQPVEVWREVLEAINGSD